MNADMVLGMFLGGGIAAAIHWAAMIALARQRMKNERDTIKDMLKLGEVARELAKKE